jgi:hypothetical protein
MSTANLLAASECWNAQTSRTITLPAPRDVSQRSRARYSKLKLLYKLTRKRDASTIVGYCRAMTIIHRDFIAYKL